jgi:membrane fusion protein (multidrug efflux system)
MPVVTEDKEKEDQAQGRAPPNDQDREEQKRPSVFRRPKFIIIGGIILVVLTFVGLLWYQHTESNESTNDAFIDAHNVPVSPQVAGQVLQVPVNDNQVVKQGDLLLQIDPSTLNAVLAQAKSSLALNEAKLQVATLDFTNAQAQLISTQAIEAQAHAQASAVESEARRAEADVARGRQLRTNNVISPEEFDHLVSAANAARANFEAARKQVLAQHSRVVEATNQVASAQAQITAARAQIADAQAAVERAQIDVSHTTITSPMGGRVTRKSIERGTYVQVGQQLMTLVPEQLWISANFKETQLRYMRPGQEVKIKIDAYPKAKYSGHVDSIQAGSGAFFSLLPPENAVGNYVKVVQRVPVKIVFDTTDTNHLLGPGMSVVPTVHVRDYRLSIWVWIAAAIILVVLLTWAWRRRARDA